MTTLIEIIKSLDFEKIASTHNSRLAQNQSKSFKNVESPFSHSYYVYVKPLDGTALVNNLINLTTTVTKENTLYVSACDDLASLWESADPSGGRVVDSDSILFYEEGPQGSASIELISNYSKDGYNSDFTKNKSAIKRNHIRIKYCEEEITFFTHTPIEELQNKVYNKLFGNEIFGQPGKTENKNIELPKRTFNELFELKKKQLQVGEDYFLIRQVKTSFNEDRSEITFEVPEIDKMFNIEYTSKEDHDFCSEYTDYQFKKVKVSPFSMPISAIYAPSAEQGEHGRRGSEKIYNWIPLPKKVVMNILKMGHKYNEEYVEEFENALLTAGHSIQFPESDSISHPDYD